MIKIKQLDKKLLILLVINLIVRLPSLFNSLDPYIFCDEQLYWYEVKRMLSQKTIVINFFKAGPVNFYPIIILLLPLEILVNTFNKSLYSTIVIVFARFLFNFVISSISIIYLLRISKLINLTKGKESHFILGLLYVLNPYLIAQTRIWYGDSYLHFFTILLTYNILKIYYGKLDLYGASYLAIILAFGASVKYNFIFLITSIFILYLVKLKEQNDFFIKELMVGIILLLFLIFILNFSAVLNFDKFLNDFLWNIENYEEPTTENYLLKFLYYFLFLFSVPVTFFGFLFVLFSLFNLIKLKKYFLITLFYFLPLTYISFFAFFDVFLNRNINLFIPFILICLNLGIDNFIYSKKRAVRNLLKLNLFALLVIYTLSTSVTIMDDLDTDSRIEARNWISERPEFYNKEVGINTTCNGSNVAKNISILIEDRDAKQNLEYYIIDDYGMSGFISSNDRRNILFIMNHKNDHYYYFKNLNFFTYRLSDDRNLIENKNYSLIKQFSGNGPNIYIFKKVN